MCGLSCVGFRKFAIIFVFNLLSGFGYLSRCLHFIIQPIVKTLLGAIREARQCEDRQAGQTHLIPFAVEGGWDAAAKRYDLDVQTIAQNIVTRCLLLYANSL